MANLSGLMGMAFLALITSDESAQSLLSWQCGRLHHVRFGLPAAGMQMTHIGQKLPFAISAEASVR